MEINISTINTRPYFWIITNECVMFLCDVLKQDEKISSQRVLCLMILSIWSWSLLQFTFVLTATKARRTRITMTETPEEPPKAKFKNGILKVKKVCCSIDVWAILINIILQVS